MMKDEQLEHSLLEARLRAHYSQQWSDLHPHSSLWSRIAPYLDSLQQSLHSQAERELTPTPDRRPARMLSVRTSWAVVLVIAAMSIFALWIALTNLSAPTTSTQVRTAHVPGEVITDVVSTAWQMNNARGSTTYYQFEKGIDESVPYEGKPSAFLRARTLEVPASTSLHQSLPITDYVGSRIRFTAYLKLESVEQRANLWLEVLNSGELLLRLDDMWDRQGQGTADWRRYDLVLDVPEGSARLWFGVQLEGTGTVWVNAARIEVVGEDVAITGERTPYNLGFEQGKRGWPALDGAHRSDAIFEIAHLDTSVAYAGSASASIVAVANEFNSLSSISQRFAADEYRGKRLRFSAYVKTEGAESRAGLWMRIGKSMPDAKLRDLLLAYDNMGDRSIRGPNDWHRYDVILDVPEEANEIDIGLQLGGVGKAWIDDAQLEIVSDDTPTTGMILLDEPRNLSFEEGLSSWYAPSSLYEAGIDRTLFHEGQASAYLKNQGAPPQQDGMIYQTISAKRYWGKRLHVSAYIKVGEVTQAETEGRVELNLDAIGPDGMVRGKGEGPLGKGATGGWEKYEQTLDVPQGSIVIQLGVRSSGLSQIWIDDIQVEDTDVVAPIPTVTSSIP